MQRLSSAIVFFFLISLQLKSQDAHFFRCIEISDNNTANLNWNEYVQNDFISYEVFHSENSGGPYQSLTTISSSSQTEYDHAGIDALNNNHFYFIRINKNNSGFTDSDTLQAIRLRVVPLGTAGSIAWVRWNPVHDPPLSGTGNFIVYRKYSYSNWEQIASTSETVFYDTIFVCSDLINYRIEQQDQTSCNSVSNFHGAFLTDHTQPPIPLLDSVSITNEGYTMLGWDKSPDSSVTGYKILKRFDDGFIKWDTIASVWGIGNTSWIDSSSAPCSEIQYYKILSVDSCNKLSGGSGIGPGQVDEYMQSMLLSDLLYDPCSGVISLQWTPYINIPGGLEKYEIYVSENGGPLMLLQVLPPDSLGFEHSGVNNSAEYEYLVRAVSNNGVITSSTCKKSISTYYPDLPAYIYLNYVSVIDGNIRLKTYVDKAVDSKGYIIQRADSFSGSYQPLDTIQSGSDSFAEFIDSTANPSGQQYYYRIIATDSCGKEDLISNYGTNILLQVEPLQQQLFEFSWNDYEEWEPGVSAYHIYRAGSEAGRELIETLDPGTNSWQIDLDQQENAASFGYYVEAVKNEGGEFDFADTARSNIVFISIEAEIYMPNAFAPQQSLQDLKPISRFIEGGNYSFRIFNRWGQMIFESNDPGKGWDGRYNGEYAPMGVYFYIVTYQNPQSNIQKKGSITLIY